MRFTWRPASLFARTALTLAVALAAFQGLALAVVYRTVIVPIAERSADDLAGLIVLSAQTWVELPPAVRVDFARELATRHGLSIAPVDGAGAAADAGVAVAEPAAAPNFAFRGEIEAALGRRLEMAVRLSGSAGQPEAFVEIPLADHRLRVGFPPQRYAVELPTATLAIVALGLLLGLATALFIVRRLAVPLARTAEAARQMGAGQTPEPLPETGPDELVELARRFNRMVREVNSLIENRTTLLAGISHDLRTPMTRLRLALELLGDRPDASLEERQARVGRAIADLEAMDALIAGYLELARTARAEAGEEVELIALLGELAGRYGIDFDSALPQAGLPVTVAPLALRQVVGNLIENALRYGGGRPVTLRVARDDTATRIVVADQGPGVPPDQLDKVFRPFYRLEASRAGHTGGSGLGLAIVRQLALTQGWTVRLENRPGGGLDAIVSLPVSER